MAAVSCRGDSRPPLANHSAPATYYIPCTPIAGSPGMRCTAAIDRYDRVRSRPACPFLDTPHVRRPAPLAPDAVSARFPSKIFHYVVTVRRVVSRVSGDRDHLGRTQKHGPLRDRVRSRAARPIQTRCAPLKFIPVITRYRSSNGWNNVNAIVSFRGYDGILILRLLLSPRYFFSFCDDLKG